MRFSPLTGLILPIDPKLSKSPLGLENQKSNQMAPSILSVCLCKSESIEKVVTTGYASNTTGFTEFPLFYMYVCIFICICIYICICICICKSQSPQDTVQTFMSSFYWLMVATKRFARYLSVKGFLFPCKVNQESWQDHADSCSWSKSHIVNIYGQIFWILLWQYDGLC